MVHVNFCWESLMDIELSFGYLSVWMNVGSNSLTLWNLFGWLTASNMVRQRTQSGLNQGRRTTGCIREEGIHYTAVGDAGEVPAWKWELEDQRKVTDLLVWRAVWNLQENLPGKPDTSNCQSRIMETWWKMWFLHNYCFSKSAAELQVGGLGGFLSVVLAVWKS